MAKIILAPFKSLKYQGQKGYFIPRVVFDNVLSLFNCLLLKNNIEKYLIVIFTERRISLETVNNKV